MVKQFLLFNFNMQPVRVKPVVSSRQVAKWFIYLC